MWVPVTSQNLSHCDAGGQTALHVCALYQQTECMKLLLRVRPDLAEVENADQQTALDVARQLQNDTCVELLSHALAGKTELFENVNIDWNLISVSRVYNVVNFKKRKIFINRTFRVINLPHNSFKSGIKSYRKILLFET